MITYSSWKSTIDEFNLYNEYISAGVYAILCFLSMFTIILDLILSPFEILGVIVYIINKGVINR